MDPIKVKALDVALYLMEHEEDVRKDVDEAIKGKGERSPRLIAVRQVITFASEIEDMLRDYLIVT